MRIPVSGVWELLTHQTSTTRSILTGAESPGGNSTELRKMVETDEDLANLLIKLQDHHWRIEKSELEVCVRPDGSDCVLAEGSYGIVYRAVLNKSTTVVIKTLCNRDPSDRVAFLEEIVCLMNLRHTNIVRN